MKLSLRDWRAIIATLLLPVLAAALTIWSISGRTNRFDQVPAAIVNLDEGVHMKVNGKDQLVPLGRQLAAGLMYPSEPVTTNLKWQLVKEDQAVEGLKHGEYQAIITIPKQFSKNLTTIGTKDATAALITVTSNDASSEIMGMISAQIADAAAHSMGSVFTEKMLDQLYLGFNEFKDQLGKAADGARQLDDGAHQLGDGTGQLQAGVWELSGGAWSLANGLGQANQGANDLAAGAGELNTGASKLSSGAHQLAGGLGKLRDGVSGTPGNPGLLGGMAEVNKGVNGPGGLAEGTKALAGGAGQLSEGVDKLTTGLQKITSVLVELEKLLPPDYLDRIPDTSGLEADLDRLDAILADSNSLLAALRGQIEGDANNVGVLPQLRAALAECEAQASGADQCAQLRAGIAALEQVMAQWPDSDVRIDELLTRLQTTITDLGLDKLRADLIRISKDIAAFTEQLREAGGFAGLDTQLTKLREGAAELAAGAAQLDAGVNGKGDASPGLASGIAQLYDGVKTLDGALNGTPTTPSLVGGSEQLAAGVDQLLGGTGQLATGAGALADGIGQASSGADQLAAGTDELGAGAGQLHEGVMELIAGTTRFATELADGAEQVPSYSDAERTKIVKMGAIPVKAEDSRLNAAASSANVVFPWAAAIVLWLGAFGSYLVMPGLRRRQLVSTNSATQVAWRSLWPALVLGLLQGAGVVVVATAMGVRPVNLVGTTFLLLLGVGVFAAVNQAMLAVAGARLGRLLAMLFLVVQVVSLGGVIPIETAPPAFHVIEGVMPLSILSAGLSHTVLGGQLTNMVGSVVPLLVWGLAAVGLTIVAASKARRLTGARVRQMSEKQAALA